MTIKYQCSCGKSYSIRDELAGKTATCKQCNIKFVIPSPSYSESNKTDVITTPVSEKVKPSFISDMQEKGRWLACCGRSCGQRYMRLGKSKQIGVVGTAGIFMLILGWLLLRGDDPEGEARIALASYIQACQTSDDKKIVQLSLLPQYKIIHDGEILRFQDMEIGKQDLSIIRNVAQWIKQNMVVVPHPNETPGWFAVMKNDEAEYDKTLEHALQLSLDFAKIEKEKKKLEAEGTDPISELKNFTKVMDAGNKQHEILNKNDVDTKKMISLLYDLPAAYQKAGVNLEENPVLKWMLTETEVCFRLLSLMGLKLNDISGTCRLEKTIAVCNFTLQTKIGLSKTQRYRVGMIRLRIDDRDSGWKIESISEIQ